MGGRDREREGGREREGEQGRNEGVSERLVTSTLKCQHRGDTRKATIMCQKHLCSHNIVYTWRK